VVVVRKRVDLDLVEAVQARAQGMEPVLERVDLAAVPIIVEVTAEVVQRKAKVMAPEEVLDFTAEAVVLSPMTVLVVVDPVLRLLR
jgi:hypothetical protein